MPKLEVKRDLLVERLDHLQRQCYDLEMLDEEDLVNIHAMSDAELANEYCSSGLFEQYHDDHFEDDLVVID